MIVILLGALAIMAGTYAGAPTLSPVLVGAAIGVRGPARPGLHAAAAGSLAWAAWLLVAALRGDALGTLAGALGASMRVPGWVLFALTLVYPALLSACSAVLGYLVSPRRARRTAGARERAA